MSGLDAFTSAVVTLATHGLQMALAAAWGAAPLAGVAVLVNLFGRRWLTAGQMGVLWGLVVLRLAMPLAPDNPLSVHHLLVASTGDSSAVRPPELLAAPAMALEPTDATIAPATPAAEHAVQIPWFDWTALPPVAWFAGAAMLLGRTFLAHYLFCRRVRRASVGHDRRLGALWQSCCRRAGVRRAIPIVLCDELTQPAVMGLFGSKLLLPPRMAELDDNELRMIMLHELAHVRRRDVGLNWVLLAVRAVHWWNPIYWLAAGRFCDLREQACDAFAIRRLAGHPARSYSQLLLALAQRERRSSPWRVTLPTSLLGLLPAYFRKRALQGRLCAQRSAAWVPGRGQTTAVSGLITLSAVCGLTDAKPPAEPIDLHPTSQPPAVGLFHVDGDVEHDELAIYPCTYDLTAALSRIEATSSPTTSPIAAVKFQVENVLRNGPRCPNDASGATYKLGGSQLIAFASAKQHDELIRHVRAWEQSGLGQICLKSCFLTAKRDIAATANISWQYQGAVAADSTPALSDELPADSPIVRARAVAGVPVAFATLDRERADAIVRAGRDDRRVSLVNAPTVTMFNGQRASIMDVALHPFVVGIRSERPDAGQPEIREFENGTRITVRPVHTTDQRHVRLHGRIELNRVVRGLAVPAGSSLEATAMQFPSAKRCSIDFACQVEDGQSVLIGCLPTDTEQRFFYALITVQTVARSADGAD